MRSFQMRVLHSGVPVRRAHWRRNRFLDYEGPGTRTNAELHKESDALKSERPDGAAAFVSRCRFRVRKGCDSESRVVFCLRRSTLCGPRKDAERVGRAN
jgi:hypothetical protein